MKKLVATLALCIGTAAFAQQAKPPSEKQVPGPEVEKKMDTGVDATQVGPAIGNTAKKVVGAYPKRKLEAELEPVLAA